MLNIVKEKVYSGVQKIGIELTRTGTRTFVLKIILLVCNSKLKRGNKNTTLTASIIRNLNRRELKGAFNAFIYRKWRT